MSYIGSLLENVHAGVMLPEDKKEADHSFVCGTLNYYHYGCDGFNDKGWGCGYRTLQTICSWILHCRGSSQPQVEVPSILHIQKVLVEIEDKPQEFLGSRDWIGSMEVGFVLNQLYEVDFRILHVTDDTDWSSHVSSLSQHFQDGGSPAMMGGRTDASSKCIVGTYGQSYLLVVDPHFVGKAKDPSALQRLGWVRWYSVSELSRSSGDFYNICVPQIRWSQS